MDVTEAIDLKIGEVRTESLDMSIGEIISLHEERELIIQPDFQRLFRWTFQQRSRLVESLLLELPIPSIFLIEKTNGVLELIDGLQRVSSLIHFVSPEAINENPLILEGCDLVPELNDLSFSNLPISLRLRLKRTGIRTVIIKRQSSQFLRYEMFKRLNTGGSKLSDQDIRNVNARMLGDDGASFYKFLQECAQDVQFKITMDLLNNAALEARGDEELVLRFFAAKNYREKFRGSIGEWLDDYMEAILLGHQTFDFNSEKVQFSNVFSILSQKFGANAFVKYRNGQPIGGVAPAYFEAVSIGAHLALGDLLLLPEKDAKTRLAQTVESDEFRKVTGPGANSLPKMNRRIELIAEAFS